MSNLSQSIEEKIVELVEAKEELKRQMLEVDGKLEQQLVALGIGKAFQAPDGIVYQVVRPNGTFMYFKTIDYVRTKRAHETKGTLSKTEAKSMGFEID